MAKTIESVCNGMYTSKDAIPAQICSKGYIALRLNMSLSAFLCLPTMADNRAEYD